VEQSSLLDTSQFVELIVYNFGEPDLDAQVVIDAINVKLREDLNCAVKFNWIPWTDFQTKYSLLLASGEPIDIAYTANWTPFVEHAQKGAFMPLDDLLPVYAPISYSRFDDMDWLECSYGGSIFALPSYKLMILPEGLMYRDDLRKKYSLDPINSIETLELYLQALADNEPDIIPYHASSTLDRGITQLMWLKYEWSGAPLTGNYLAYPRSKDQAGIREVFNYIDTPEFEEFCRMTKDWYERGFWSRNVLSNQVSPMDSMVNGRSGIAICHLDRCKGDVGDPILADHPEWEPTGWFFNDNIGYYFRPATMQDATALPRTCRYPERSLSVIELLINDREYFDLWMYGIQDKHYVLDDQGRYSIPPGVSVQENAYNPQGINTWNLRNMDLERESATPNQWEDFHVVRERMLGIAMNSKLNAFQLNRDPIQAELAALAQLDAQYMLPLLYGSADLATLDEFRQQLKAAGVEKVLAEVTGQIAAFADMYGY